MTDTIIRNRLQELAEKSYKEGVFLFTDFLSVSDLSCFYEIRRELEYAGTTVSGGVDGAERCMVRFGSEENFGYEVDFPIQLLHISPLQKKFSDTLTHRDILGSVIGLGLERSKLGDIKVKDNEAFIFVSDVVSEYIIQNLSYVKHTHVKVELCEDIPPELAPEFVEESIIVSSNRLDAIIARVYKMSRDISVRFISEGKVFINGREMTGNAKPLKPGDIVSVRGKGRFIFEGEGGATRKDKLYINIRRYV